jgi:hypothetical protein
MKTRILTLTAVALLATLTMRAGSDGVDTVTAGEAASAEQFDATINLYPDDVVEFRVDKPANDIVWLKVLDEKGLIMFAKRIKKASLLEVDVKTGKLPEGTYDYIVVRNGKEVLRKSITSK